MSGPVCTIPAPVLETIAAMRDAGRAYEAIAAVTGIKPKTCEYHAIRLGAFAPRIVLHSGRRQHVRSGHPVRGFTAIEDAQITALSVAGKTTTEIARAIGRKHNSVLNRLRALARREAISERQP